MAVDLRALSDECFFIAPIGAPGSPERERSDGVLEFIVAPAAAELGLAAVRADQIGEPGQITLQVIDHVLGARASVADLTSTNANVFYELAVRHTAKLPVVLIAEDGEELPFDIAQMRTIFFTHTNLKSASEARDQIRDQLQASLEGAVNSPIATSVDLQTLEGGGAVERRLAELVTSVEVLAQDVSRTHEVTSMLASGIGRGGDVSPAAIDDLMDTAERLQFLAGDRADTELDHLGRRLEDIGDYLISRLDLPQRRRSPSERARRARRTREELARLDATREELARLETLDAEGRAGADDGGTDSDG